jgi:hypothetical protein
MVGLELLGGLECCFQRCGRQSREEGLGDRRIDLAATDAQAVFASPVNDVFSGAMIAGRRVTASVMHPQAPPAVPADGDALQQCRALVLVHSPDRLSRRYAYQVLLLEEFSLQGVEVRFLKGNAGQTPEEQLLVQFQGMIAEYERAQITERCRRGKRHRAKTGLVKVLSGAALRVSVFASRC